MNFTKKEIKSEKVAIIDIWSYKIRAWICKLKNKKIELVWYWEKRQNSEDIVLWEFVWLQWICENLKLAIKKAEQTAWIKVKNIIINFPFGEVFFSAKNINYRRWLPQNSIDKKEINEIIKKVEKEAIWRYIKDIEENTPYEKWDLKIIISSITRIKVDSKEKDDLINIKWENINICLLNAFISYDKYSLLKFIEKVIKKDIIKVIPSEIAITKLFSHHKDIIIINVWNNHTSIIVKKNNYINGIEKVNLWINDLIKKISKKNKKTKIDIISSIDSGYFLEEKEEFLKIFKKCITMWLEEILKWKICPNKFFITWWWANNFLKKYIKEIGFNNSEIKILWNIDIIELKIDFEKEIISKFNIWIIWMIKRAENIMSSKKDPLIESIKKAIKDIEKS